MEKALCRICLAENIRMLDIADLQNIYEKLTELPFVTKAARPLKACYICYARLKNCQILMKKCYQSELILTQMLNGVQQDLLDVQLSNFKSLITTPVVHISINDVADVNVKKEIEVPVIGGGVEMKMEVEHKEEPYYYPIPDPLEDSNIFQMHYGEPKYDAEVGPPCNAIRNNIIIENIKSVSVRKTKYGIKERTSSTNKSKYKIQKLKADKTESDATFIKVEEMTIPCEPDIVGTDGIQDYTNYETDLNDWVKTGVKIELNTNETNEYSSDRDQDSDKPKAYHNSTKRKRKIKRESCLDTSNKNTTEKISHKCPICQKTFSYRSNLKYHLYTHTGERPFQCDMCGKGFAQNKQLKNHILMHTGEKPYKCELCSNSFHLKHSLRNHYRVHSGETPFECEVCHRQFKEKSSLIKHGRIHTGEKPYKCDQCPSSFKLCHTLKNHMRTHTGEKPYKCTFCEMCFSKDSNLKAHIRIHTGERPYKCEICQRSFNQKSALNTHTRTHEKHNKKAENLLDRKALIINAAGENSNSSSVV